MAEFNFGDDVRFEETADGKLRIIDQETGETKTIESVSTDE